jgi:uncharacterized membrane protein
VLVAIVCYFSSNVIGSGSLESIELVARRMPFVELGYSSIALAPPE